MKVILLLLLLLCTVNADIGTLLQVTDIHYDQLYKTGSSATCLFAEKIGLRCCREYDIPISPYRKAGIYGDYDCDTPKDLIELSFKWIKDSNITIDMLLWTGDSAGHHDLTQSFDFNMRAVDDMTDIIKKYLPHTKIIPVIGNHDTWPIDQLLPPDFKSTAVTRHLAKSWNEWLPTDSYDTFYYGGYYKLPLSPNHLLVVVNCLYEDTHNELDKISHDPAHQDKWLRSTIYDAHINNKKVWIVGHIFPGALEATNNFTNLIIDLTTSYPETIVNQFYGHSHKDQYKLFRKNGTDVAHLYIAPSLVPDKHEPGFRIYKYDKATYEILDYDQYYANLASLNSHNMQGYKKVYSAKNEYNLSDLSTRSWSNLYTDLSTNKNYFDKYYHFFSYPSDPSECNSNCRKSHLCDIRYVNKNANNKCNA